MAQKYRFVCPVCEEQVIVDRHVRDELLVEGCAVCSSGVSRNCFDPM